MNSLYRCGDQEALVSYLYEEGTPAERDAVAAHLAHCASCAEEVETLRSTRTLLAEWRPPMASLGFQIAAPAARPEPAVLRPAAWWRQPLPAWAQAAAAVLIFAAGVAAGMGRAGAAGPAPAPAAATNNTAAAAAATPVAQVTRQDLARLEQRLVAAEAMAARAQTRGTVSVAADEDAIVRRLQTMVNQRVEESEARQRETVALTLANIARGFEMQERQVRALNQAHDVTAREVRQQRDAWESVMPLVVRASFSQPPSAR